MRISLTLVFMVIFLVINVNSFIQPNYRKQSLNTMKFSAPEASTSDALPAALVPGN